MRTFLKKMWIVKKVQKIKIPKLQDVFHNIYRVRDSEHNKKRSIVLASKLYNL